MLQYVHMKREIKFRCWNNNKRSMHIVTTLYAPNGVGNTMELDGEGAYGDLYPIMQFTGLHDKNGQEIYEGDIVVERPGAHPSVVEFRDGSFQAVHKHHDLTGAVTGEYEQVIGCLTTPVEVLGNIHETPALLH